MAQEVADIYKANSSTYINQVLHANSFITLKTQDALPLPQSFVFGPVCQMLLAILIGSPIHTLHNNQLSNLQTLPA